MTTTNALRMAHHAVHERAVILALGVAPHPSSGKSWDDVIADLRRQTWPCEVNPGALADLIEALQLAGSLR